MKSKIFYLIGFITLIWLGMTKTGRDLISLSNQTSNYTYSKNEYTIRFFGTSQLGLSATLSPAKQGLILSPGQNGTMKFTVSNMSNQKQVIAFSSEITPNDYSQYFDIIEIPSILLKPSEIKDIEIRFTLNESISKDIDTLYLSLTALKSEVSNISKNQKVNLPSKR